MSEQAIFTALGSLGTIAVTAVSALAYTVRQHKRNGLSGANSLAPVLERMCVALDKLTEASITHSRESAERHAVLSTIMAQLQRAEENRNR